MGLSWALTNDNKRGIMKNKKLKKILRNLLFSIAPSSKCDYTLDEYYLSLARRAVVGKKKK
jgi:hypothetical protein